ncbi:MAG: SMC-Scp complex subunit ScpB [Candidatus Aminicenantales bacterium]
MNPGLKDIIESLIFVSLEPISLAKIQEVLADVHPDEVERALAELLAAYQQDGHGIQIAQMGSGYIFCTKPGCDPWVKRLLKIDRKSKLSSAALETLSIIAYHQPITLSEISALRGVDSSSALKTLLEKRLIRIVGRKQSPGKPLIYRTTDRFLAHFGLTSLEDLPSEEEIAKILGEKKNNETKT